MNRGAWIREVVNLMHDASISPSSVHVVTGSHSQGTQGVAGYVNTLGDDGAAKLVGVIFVVISDCNDKMSW